jgi:hypothetical protein
MKKIILGSLILIFLVSFGAKNVLADAWWGEGYRAPDWVRKNGGTTITYTIINGSAKKYKGMMFQNGQYVEVEFGNNAVFDDAKNGVYTVSFYKCKDSCMPHKYNHKTKIRGSDKKVATTTVIARPGEDVRLVFNAANNSITFTSGTAGRKIDPFVAVKKLAKEHAGEQDPIFDSAEKQYKFMQLALNQEEINLEDIDKYIQWGILPKSFGSQDNK